MSNTLDDLLPPAEVARRLGVHPATLRRWRMTGTGPAYARIGVRLVRYPAEAVRDWAAARTYAARAEEVAHGRAA